MGLAGGRMPAGGQKGASCMAMSLPLTWGTRTLGLACGGFLPLRLGHWGPGMLVPNLRAAPDPGGSPQPSPSQTSVPSSLKMGVTRLTCLTGVRVN